MVYSIYAETVVYPITPNRESQRLRDAVREERRSQWQSLAPNGAGCIAGHRERFGEPKWKRFSLFWSVERRAVNETKWEVYNYYMGVR